MKLYVKSYFEDLICVEYDPLENLKYDKDGKLVIPVLTSFEKCLMV